MHSFVYSSIELHTHGRSENIVFHLCATRMLCALLRQSVVCRHCVNCGPILTVCDFQFVQICQSTYENPALVANTNAHTHGTARFLVSCTQPFHHVFWPVCVHNVHRMCVTASVARGGGLLHHICCARPRACKLHTFTHARNGRIGAQVLSQSGSGECGGGDGAVHLGAPQCCAQSLRTDLHTLCDAPAHRCGYYIKNALTHAHNRGHRNRHARTCASPRAERFVHMST